jgi:hypothetical protein
MLCAAARKRLAVRVAARKLLRRMNMRNLLKNSAGADGMRYKSSAEDVRMVRGICRWSMMRLHGV